MFANRLLILFLAAFSLTASNSVWAYSSVVVYGDSLSDNGNLYAASGNVYPPSPPYYQGRRSNGPLAVEQLASKLGAPLVDFAWIGATTGLGNYADGGTVTTPGALGAPGMLASFGQSLPLYSTTLNPLIANGLFVVWGGANDLLTQYPLGEPLDQIIADAVTNEVLIIKSLQSLGVNHILAPGMPDLGLTPDAITGNNFPISAAQASIFTDQFNAALQAALSSLLPGVIYADTASLLRSIVANPAAYGFTDASDPCFNGVTLCGNPNAYVFYDGFHPTTATNALLANAFYTAVPEPATVMLLVPGLAMLFAARRRLA